MVLMEQMILTGRFAEFITAFLDLYNKEQEEKTTWEYWLHRVYDKSYADFVSMVNKPNRAAPTQEEIKSTIEGSFSILQSFDPLRKGVNGGNGTVQTAGNDSG